MAYNILHISSDFACQSVYNNLVNALSNFDLKQSVFVPVRNENEIKTVKYFYNKNVKYYYSDNVSIFDRIHFYRKINKTYIDLVNKINPKTIDLIHSHFLFSDGAVAYKLFNEYGIKYITAIRNTDVNFFFKHMPHLRGLGLEIMNNSEQIIFVTPAYADYVLEKYVPKYSRKAVEKKILIIPNGIDNYWLTNSFSKNVPVKKKEIKLLFIGDFSKNKNIHNSIKAIEKLRKEGIVIQYNIVGGGSRNQERIEKLIEKKSEFINNLGPIYDKDKLRKVFRGNDIFVMPSIKETFGLVYIEALSQGLPIIYTKGQGVDGYFDDVNIGIAVNPKSVDEIISAILEIRNRYNFYLPQKSDFLEQFRWSNIAKRYIEVYSECLKS